MVVLVAPGTALGVSVPGDLGSSELSPRANRGNPICRDAPRFAWGESSLWALEPVGALPVLGTVRYPYAMAGDEARTCGISRYLTTFSSLILATYLAK